MLHLLAEKSVSEAVVERISAGDDVVLQSACVWAALDGHGDNRKLASLLSKSCRVFVMRDLLEACGIAEERLLAGVVAIDYPQLVELTIDNPVIQTWC